jgi:hypothetical protein
MRTTLSFTALGFTFFRQAVICGAPLCSVSLGFAFLS